MSDWAWQPTADYINNANITRLMWRFGCGSIDQLRERSIEDIGAFWDAVVEDLDIPFRTPYTQTFDSSAGIEWTKWFVGGHCNIAHACVDRWLNEPEVRDSKALIAINEDGRVREHSYAELAVEVERAAAALTHSGIRPGDSVAVFLPMISEAIIVAYAIAKVGAIYLPIFSGFAADAVAVRCRDAGAKLIVTSDGAWRRGKQAALKPVCDAAVELCETIESVIVVNHLGNEVELQLGRDQRYEDWIAREVERSEAYNTGADDPFMLGYTSGTTGKPKGAVLPHGGFLVKIASEVAYQVDVHRGQKLFWVTDMGWIMGPFSMVGAHANAATMVLLQGAPDFPNPDRIWKTVDEHAIEVLGISPTLIRTLKSRGDEWIDSASLSSLRILASTSEPWNSEPYRWLSEHAGGGRLPIINLSGGTEVAACFLSPYPVEPIKECSLGGASLGMDVDVFDPEGKPIRNAVGELVCKQPWPSMTRGVWGDSDRYLSSYWSTYPGTWRHGDWAKIDADGQWFLLGRSDEAINIAGKRLGPSEMESVLVGHPAVAEAATIGVPDQTKGEAAWCFWVPVDPNGEDVSAELSQLVTEKLGRPFKPARIVRVEALPKTRSAKILRRAIRQIALGEPVGDLSTAENPEALTAIERELKRTSMTATRTKQA